MFDARTCLHAARKISIIDLTIKGRLHYAADKTIRDNYPAIGFDDKAAARRLSYWGSGL